MPPSIRCWRGSRPLRQLCQPSRHLTSPVRSDTIFSGIQPTGVPHLGNYLGALQQWVKIQNEAEKSSTLIFSLVDLHAITIRQDPALLRQWKKESMAMLFAIGLDPTRSIVFHQSDVPAHAELMWILSCQASTGYLGRMTQWKDKTSGDKEHSEKLKLGLFSYPVLQAADILLYQTTHVPVGHDQAQHLEFARELAIGFNHVYASDVFTIPETIISPAKRIMSLTDPSSKMSKSHPNIKSRILLTDSEATIRSKIKTAVTDSHSGIAYDPANRAGISNLLEIMYHASQPSPREHDLPDGGLEALAKEMEGWTFRAFKDRVTEVVEQTVRPIRERYASIIANDQLLDASAADAAERARRLSASTLGNVKSAVGIC